MHKFTGKLDHRQKKKTICILVVNLLWDTWLIYRNFKVKSDLAVLGILHNCKAKLSVSPWWSASLNLLEKALPDAQETLGKNRHLLAEDSLIE